MNITNHHVAYTVINMDIMLNFYSKLDFIVCSEYVDENIAIIHLINKNNFIIELFKHKNIPQKHKEKEKVEEHLKHIGILHNAFQVDNLSEFYTFIKDVEKVEIVTPIVQGRTGIMYFFIYDPENNLIEFIQKK